MYLVLLSALNARMTRSSTAGGYASSSSADTKPPNNTRGGGGNKRQRKTSVAAGTGLSGDHSSMMLLADPSACKEEPTFVDQHNLFTPVEARSKNDGSIGFSTLKRIFYNSGLESEPSTAQSTTLSRGIAFRDQQQQDDYSAVSSQLAELKKTIETLSASNSSLAASHSWLEKKLAAQESSRDNRNQQQPEVKNVSVPPRSKRTKREDRTMTADVTMGHLPPADNAPARREFPASRNRDKAAQTSHDHSDDHSSVTGGSSVDDSRGSRKARRADYMERQRRYLLIFD